LPVVAAVTAASKATIFKSVATHEVSSTEPMGNVTVDNSSEWSRTVKDTEEGIFLSPFRRLF